MLVVGMACNGCVAAGPHVFTGQRARKVASVHGSHTFQLHSHSRAESFATKSGPPWLLSPEGLLDLMVWVGIRGQLMSVQ